MGARKIETARLLRMVEQGKTTRQIADTFCVLLPEVIRACHAANIRLPGTVPTDLPLTPASATSVPMNASERCEAELIASGGTHAALAAWAATWGTSLTAARLRWARLKLPLAVERTR